MAALAPSRPPLAPARRKPCELSGMVVTSLHSSRRPRDGASGRGLMASLLHEQQELSAVERFARWQDRRADGPESAKSYRELLPPTPPAPGWQYAFEVDLDRCSGCKACVSACHALNGLDDGEAWRDTGLLVSEDWRRPFQQVVTTACHHCVEPACLEGCPVLAYDKDPLTGIVKHLDDQCIGCQYCVMKCPYDVPQYSAARGIVRKCDLCSSRLAANEAPACVQACPTSAIRITTVELARVRGQYRPLPHPPVRRGKSPTGAGEQPRPAHARSGRLNCSPAHLPPTKNAFLPCSPDPAITLPTTRYRTKRVLPETLRAADRETLKPEPAHWPLVFMLVLTQMSIGMVLGGTLLGAFEGDRSGTRFVPVQFAVATLVGIGGLAASVAHLGRPLGAWRSFLGLRTSWLSREIVAFGLYTGLTVAVSVSAWALANGGMEGVAASGLASVTALAGLLAGGCSVMVYADTRRAYWRLASAGSKFGGTTCLLGALGTLLVLLATGAAVALVQMVAAGAAVAGLFKLAADQRVLRHVADDDFSPLHKTALLLTGRFGGWDRVRAAATLAGGVGLPLLIALQLHGLSPTSAALSVAAVGPLIAQAALAAALAFGGELIERALFFLTVQPVKMPGSVAL